VDLELASGETIAVLGPNGSGKSTLIRLAAGDLLPTGGGVDLFGVAARRRSVALRRRLGVALDTPVHFGPLSGLANAVFFGRASGLAAPDARREAERLLDGFGMSDELHVPVEEYSLGMHRKLLLTEALMHEPPILLLDEPTLGLDLPSVATLASELQRRVDFGGATLLSTNDVRAAEALASRVVFLRKGEQVADAPLAELLRSVRTVTQIDVRFAGTLEECPPLPAGVSARLAPNELIVESREGASALPHICRALLDAGVSIQDVSVREGDLGDVFRKLTGAELTRRPDDEHSGVPA